MSRPCCDRCGVTSDRAELREVGQSFICAICFGDDEGFEELPILIPLPHPANINGGPVHAA